MKKIFFSLIIFFSIFLFIDKVGASFELIQPSFSFNQSSTYINNYNHNLVTSNVTYSSTNYSSSFNRFLAYINNETYKTYGDYYLCSFSVKSGYNASCFISDNLDNFVVSPYYPFNSNNIKLRLGYYNGSSGELAAYRIFDNILETSFSVGSVYINSGYEMENSSVVVFTNVPYFKYRDTQYSTSYTTDGYYFNNNDVVFINSDDGLVLNTSYKTSEEIMNPNPPVQIYNNEINDINYSEMIFDFDLSILESRNNVFDGVYDISVVGGIDENGENLDTDYRPEFTEPYLEYVDSFGIVNTLKIFDYDDGQITRNYWYGTFQDTVPADITSMKLIIPMYDTGLVRYSVNVTTFFPFEVSFLTDEGMFSYYETLDLSNKYGVMFMPKLVDSLSDITAFFQTRSIDSILIYDTYDYNDEPIRVFNSNISNFSYMFDYENINYNLFFKVNENSTSALVDYDTRYFTYKIVDSKYSLGVVTNPNTGEEHYIDFSNTNNTKVNFDDISDVFEFIGEKLDPTGNSYWLFANSVNMFFFTMPTDIYILVLTILAFLLIGTVLALGGWK